MNQHSLHTSVAVDAPDFPALDADRWWWELYEQSFPSSERDPRDVIAATLTSRRGFALRARADGRTIGLAVAHLLHGPGATFLVYLAVAPEWRKRHVGRALFDTAHATGAESLGSSATPGMVWEIDDPGEPADETERAARLGRRSFFERLGGRTLDTPYLQPPVDGRTIVPMRLMYRAPEGGSMPDDAAIAELVRAMYFEKYSAMNGISVPVLEGLLARVRA